MKKVKKPSLWKAKICYIFLKRWHKDSDYDSSLIAMWRIYAKKKRLAGQRARSFTLLLMVCFLKCRKDFASQETNPRYCCKVQPGNPQGNPRFCNKANYAQAKQFHFLTKLLALVVASPCLLSGTLDIGNTLTSKWAVTRPFKEKEYMLGHAKHFCN